MRVWGRVSSVKTGVYWSEVATPFGDDTNTWAYSTNDTTRPYSWVEVDTDANGYNDEVMLTAFCQVLQLQPGESPFYAQYGVPSIQAVQSQVYPTANVYYMQQLYAPNFIALSIIPTTNTDTDKSVYPVYNVTAVANSGAILTAKVAI